MMVNVCIGLARYLRIPDGVVDMVQEDAIRLQRMKAEKGAGKGTYDNYV